ncbi:MAG: class I SAM-dependent methyltransferase [Bradymonadia bacterium]
MTHALYGELIDWYHLIDPVADHAEEAALYASALKQAAAFEARTLLELGAGAGNNIFHLKQMFQCTATDLSPEMLGLSETQNPECSHHVGDMRTLRLDTQFDTVLVHDAVVYMTSEADLRAMAETAFMHTRPGGAALFAPDCLRESFSECADMTEPVSEGNRALMMSEWVWDPDPTDTTYTVNYVFMLREGDSMRIVHDEHVEGLFSKETWIEVLSSVGFEVQVMKRALEEIEPEGCYSEEIFLCRRPL